MMALALRATRRFSRALLSQWALCYSLPVHTMSESSYFASPLYGEIAYSFPDDAEIKMESLFYTWTDFFDKAV